MGKFVKQFCDVVTEENKSLRNENSTLTLPKVASRLLKTQLSNQSLAITNPVKKMPVFKPTDNILKYGIKKRLIHEEELKREESTLLDQIVEQAQNRNSPLEFN